MAIVAAWLGFSHVTCATEPRVTQDDPPELGEDTASSFRMATMNLFHPPYQRTQRTEAAAETLAPERPDILFLQEVGAGGMLKDNPAQILARKLGLPHWKWFAYENLLFYRQGSAIATRYPILQSEGHVFRKNTWMEKKGFLWARIRTPRGDLNVISVHLFNALSGSEEPKRSQFEELAEFIDSKRDDAPVLLAGDFNGELAGDETFLKFVRSLDARNLYDDVPLGKVRTTWETKLLDYVFYIEARRPQGFLPNVRFLSGGIVVPHTNPMPSDHFPVAARFGQ